MMKKFEFYKKLHLVDYLLLSIFFFLAIAFLIFFFRSGEYVKVTVKVTDKNVLYSQSTPPSWFVYLFKKGMKTKDGLGRTNAEIMDVYYYDSDLDQKAVYLTLSLRAVLNNRTGQYKYEGNPLSVGEGLRINLEKMLIDGLIVEVEGLDSLYEDVFYILKTQLINENSVFLESTGVEPFVAEAIKVGDKIFDSKGDIIVEVLKKDVYPAKKNTFDNFGNIRQNLDPRRKDVNLTLKVRTKKIFNEAYFLDDIRLKVNNTIPLHFENISIWPTVTEIQETN